jgi:hypothetical protein
LLSSLVVALGKSQQATLNALTCDQWKQLGAIQADISLPSRRGRWSPSAKDRVGDVHPAGAHATVLGSIRTSGVPLAVEKHQAEDARRPPYGATLMGRLREKNEPFPWERQAGADADRRPDTDKMLTAFFKRRPDFGIIRCNNCGRWQEFQPSHTFEAIRVEAEAAGWRRDGVRDLCPVCVGN